VTGRDEIGKKARPAAALFVLFGLLFNVATAAGAQLDRDPRAARLANSEIVRTVVGPRLASRNDDDGSGREDVGAALPPAPQLVALTADIHPAGAAPAPSATARPLDRPSSYRARAPPAA
jgi:hypothetical protein